MAWSRSKMRFALSLTVSVWACGSALPVRAQSVEELQSRLTAQEQINLALQQRIQSLEAELANRQDSPRGSPIQVTEALPEEEQLNALERTFVRRGVAVLPRGIAEVAPALLWSHEDGADASPTDDMFGAVMDARIGLADGWMVGASAPILHRRLGDGGGDALGVGDISTTVWKSLMEPQDGRPSLVASLRYSAPTGGNGSTSPVPLGSGFHQLTASLSVAKSLAPIAFTGSVRYTTTLADTFRGVDMDRDDIFAAAMGANLAVTPDVSVSTGLDFTFAGAQRIEGIRIDGSGHTRAAFEIGVGTVIARNTFLTIGSAIGITGNVPDLTLGVSLPIRF